MMGPLAGIGDPVFWFTVRPILGAIAASLATSGSVVAPLFFSFFECNPYGFLMVYSRIWLSKGAEITKDLSGGLLQTITKGASILGMFVMGILVQRWTSINFPMIVSKVPLSKGAYVEFPKEAVNGEQLQKILGDLASGVSLTPEKVTTLQDNLNQLVPGLAALLLTFLCMWLLKKKVSQF